MGRFRRCRSRVAAGACILAAAIAARAEGPPPAPLPDAAASGGERLERLERLERDLAELRRDLDEERRARKAAMEALAAARAASPPGAAAVAPGSMPLVGPLVRGNLSAVISGYLQADAVAYRQDSEDQLDSTGKPLNQTRFLIRRAHLRADAGWRFLSGALELEASTVSDAGVRLFGAEVSAAWASGDPAAPPYASLTLGLLRIPFGYETQERDTTRLFLERSAVVRALFPGVNDLGVRVQGGFRFLRYQLAAMNGHPLGDAGFAALDPSAQKDLLGRLGIDSPIAGPVRLTAGISGLYGNGFHAGTPATKDTLVWRDENGDGIVQPSEVQAIPGTAATPSQTFERYAVGADLRLTARLPWLGELTVYGELVWATNLDRALLVADPVSVGRSLRELGWYLGLTQELTRYALVGARYDRYSPDADALHQQGAARVPVDTSSSTLAIAIAGQLAPWGRLSLEYDHNTNALGRTTGGAPTTLGADALTLRAQLVF